MSARVNTSVYVFALLLPNSVMRESTITIKKLRQFGNNQPYNVNTSTKTRRTKKHIANKTTDWQRNQRIKIKNKSKHLVQSKRKRTNRKQLTVKPLTGGEIQNLKQNETKNHILEQTLHLIESRRTTTKRQKNKVPLDVTGEISAHIKLEHNCKEKSVETFSPFSNFNFSTRCCNTFTCMRIATDSDLSLRDKQSVFHLQAEKKLRHYDNHKSFLNNETLLPKKKLPTMQLQRHLSVQQQELIQQLQLVQKQYLIHQGLQLDFQTQHNKSPCSGLLNREYPHIHLQHQNSLTRGVGEYYETNFLLQHQQQQLHQQQPYTLHEQHLNLPVNEYRQKQYEGDIESLATNNKLKNIHLNMNSTLNSSKNKQFIKLIKATTTVKPRDKQSEEHSHQTYRIESECKSITSDASHRESDDSSLCDELNHTIECVDGDDPPLQSTSRLASTYCCSRTAGTSFGQYKRNTSSNGGNKNKRSFHKHKCITRQIQQRQKELHVNDERMSKTSGNDDDNIHHGCISFPGDASECAANEDNMLVLPRVCSPSIGSLYSSKNAQQSTLSTYYYSQRIQRPTRTVCLSTSSPSSSLDEDNSGRNNRHTVKEMDEFSTWANTIDQVSNVTDDINGYIHYQHRITGERSRSRSRSRSPSRSRSSSRSPCLSSGNSNENTTINNGNAYDGANYKSQTFLDDNGSQRNIIPTRLQHQRDQKQQFDLGKSNSIPVSPQVILPPPPLPSSPTVTLTSAAAASAAAALQVQSPHPNAAAAVAVAAAVAAAAVASSGCTSDAPMTPNFDNLLNALNGSGGRAENIGSEYNDVVSAIATSTGNAANTANNKKLFSSKKCYHPLYAHGICHWPGCELALYDFTAFVKLIYIDLQQDGAKSSYFFLHLHRDSRYYLRLQNYDC